MGETSPPPAPSSQLAGWDLASELPQFPGLGPTEWCQELGVRGNPSGFPAPAGTSWDAAVEVGRKPWGVPGTPPPPISPSGCCGSPS